MFLEFTAVLLRDETADVHSNIYSGLIGVTVFFLIISIFTLPNGPFTRPHPAFWRCVLGASIMYLLLLQFLIHQDYQTIRSMVIWFDPKMANYTIDSEKEYGTNCWDISAEFRVR